jgi:elongation factor G
VDVNGYPITGVKVTLEGGSYHAVDSSEIAFRYAAKQAFVQAFPHADPIALEPMMLVEVETPSEFVGRIQGDLSARRGMLLGSQTQGVDTIIRAEVPLEEMFGYSKAVRSLTSGQATFSMEFVTYRPIPTSLQAQLVAAARS